MIGVITKFFGGIPTVYLLIGGAVLLGSWSFYMDHRGYKRGYVIAENKAAAVQLKAERASNMALAAANARAAKSDERFSAIQQDMEKKQHENQAIIDTTRKQLASVKRLRDPGYRAASCGQLPKDAAAAGDITDATPSGYISDEFTEFLKQQAYAADQVAVYAKTCHDWVVSIGRVAE